MAEWESLSELSKKLNSITKFTSELIFKDQSPPSSASTTVALKDVNLGVEFHTMNCAYPSIIRLAGISGALAVSLGAYGAHAIRDKKDVAVERKTAFEAGSRYHLLHSVVLLACPLASKPLLSAGLFTGGILLFSGCYYYSAITGDPKLRKITPYGGFLLICGWLSLIL